MRLGMHPHKNRRRSNMSDRTIYDGLARSIREPEMRAPDFLGENAVVHAGVAVYRNNVRSSLSKALAETFPVVAQLVGEDFFKYAARAYFDAHPPASPLVARYGDKFPAFLETFAPAASTPYLPDMARLERAWLNAYRAADATPLARDAILAEAGDDPSDLTFTLHPSVRLLRSPYAVASLWRRHQKGADEAPFDVTRAEYVLMARPRLQVDVRTVSPGTYATISALARGQTVGDALAAGAAADQTFNPQDAFRSIFSAEIVTHISRCN